MKRIVFIIITSIVFISCGNNIKVTGKIKKIKDGYVYVCLDSKSGARKVIDSVEMVSGLFNYSISDIQPPAKVIFDINHKDEFGVWCLKNKVMVEGEFGNLSASNIRGSILHNSVSDTRQRFNDMYIKPLRKMINWLDRIESKAKRGKKLSKSTIKRQKEYKRLLERAYERRALSVVNTIKDCPSSEIALALLFDEYENISESDRKLLISMLEKKFFASTALWQIKN